MVSGLKFAQCDPLIRTRNYAQMRNFISHLDTLRRTALNPASIPFQQRENEHSVSTAAMYKDE